MANNRNRNAFGIAGLSGQSLESATKRMTDNNHLFAKKLASVEAALNNPKLSNQKRAALQSRLDGLVFNHNRRQTEIKQKFSSFGAKVQEVSSAYYDKFTEQANSTYQTLVTGAIGLVDDAKETFNSAWNWITGKRQKGMGVIITGTVVAVIAVGAIVAGAAAFTFVLNKNSEIDRDLQVIDQLGKDALPQVYGDYNGGTSSVVGNSFTDIAKQTVKSTMPYVAIGVGGFVLYNIILEPMLSNGKN